VARVNKWIYSWEIYKKVNGKWRYHDSMHSHKDYKYYRKEYNDIINFVYKWVERRKPNPEYKGV
jgi:hypothetical protein